MTGTEAVARLTAPPAAAPPAAPRRFLFFKEQFAWPRASGHDVHTYYLMRALAEAGHAVSVATVDPPPDAALAGVAFAKRFVLADTPVPADGLFPVHATRSQAKFQSYWGTPPDRIRQLAAAAEACAADTVVVSGLNVLPYLTAIQDRQRVWYAADEWVWHHVSMIQLSKPATWTEMKHALVKGLYERAYRKLLTRVWVVTPTDAEAFRWLAGIRQTDVLPNGVDTGHYTPDPAADPEPHSCTFWGRLDFGPNVQAAEYFVRRVWPAVRKAVPDAKLRLYGFQPTPPVRALAGRDGVTLTADLPDIRPAVRAAQVVVLPFVSGGGIKNKLLEACAMGLPVVATRRAWHGLTGRPPLIPAARPADWVKALTTLWGDAGERASVGAAGRDWVAEHHTWAAAARTAAAGLAGPDSRTGGRPVSKFLLLVGLTLGGGVGALARGPFVPTAVYYLYAVLRPQALWKFQLAAWPSLGWSFYAAAAALLSYLPWVYGVAGTPDDPGRRVWPRFVWPHRMMLGFGVWQTLSYLNANDMTRAAPYYEEFAKILVMYLLSTQVLRSVGQIRVLYLVVLGALAYLAFEFLQIYYTTGYLVLYRRGFSDLDNNGAALMLAMGVPLCFFAWEFTAGYHRWLYLAVIPVIAEVVMSSYSRGAMLSALAVAPLYLLYSRKRRFLLAVFAAAAVAVPVVAGKEIKARFFSASEGSADDSFASRLVSWDCARRIANDYPVFGAGIRCSNLLTLDYGADLFGRTIHNQYLQIAADSGWVGMAWYLALVGTAFGAMWKARRRLWRQTDPESVRTVALLGGVELSLATFMVGSVALSLEMFEPPYLMMLLGSQVWAIANAQVTPPPARRVPARRVPAPPAGVRR